MKIHRIVIMVASALLVAANLQAGVVINRITPWAGDTGLSEDVPSQFSLYNAGGLAADLTGWEVRNTVAPAFTIALPPVTLPADGFLTLILGAGLDDFDFSDGAGIYHAGPVGKLRQTSGELGLHTSSLSTSITDYVRWGIGGAVASSGHTDAVNAGIWSASSAEYVDLSGYALFSLMARIPSGYDSDTKSDWQEYEARYAESYNQHNALQLAPLDGELLANVISLEWRSAADADSYWVEVANDPAFGAPLLSVVTTAASIAVSFGDGYYYWRVRTWIDGILYRAGIYRFARNTPPVAIQLGVERIFQGKDTWMVCLYKYKDAVIKDSSAVGEADAKDKRPGCLEGAGPNGPWDNGHPDDIAHILHCGHCGMYCTRGSLYMVNQYFRRVQEGAGYVAATQLSQDEISYRLKWNGHTIADPEDDLGHGEGAWADDNNVYSWSLNDAPVTRTNAALPFAQLMNEIDNSRPVLVTVKNGGGGLHAVVFSGYAVLADGKGFVHISDPWPGGVEWQEYDKIPLVNYFTINAPAHTVIARLSDPGVYLDSDRDGLVDFDEGFGVPWFPLNPIPRRIQSRPDNWDTDGDRIGDFSEVRSYTFHDTDHPLYDAGPHDNDELTFPDVDGDGMRAERDVNTDGDLLTDNLEDINLNGRSPQRGETCVYASDDADMNVAGFCNGTFALIRPQGVTDYVINVPRELAITDVDLVLSFEHGRTEDLTVDLLSPTGTTRRVLNRLCNGSSIHGARYFERAAHWDDDAPQATQCQGLNSFYNDWYQPQQSFAPFNGENSLGNWIVRFNGLAPDYFGGGDTIFCACLIIRYDRILPVELTSFEAIAGDADVLLRWQTASELNNDHFDIERDGQLMGRVDGAGSSSEENYYSWHDRTVQNGTTYRYTLFAVNTDGTREAKAAAEATPVAGGAIISAYALYQNYPNPFNPQTKITFDLMEPGTVMLRVYDLLGREVAIPLPAERMSGGRHSVQFDATNLPSGLYVYELEANGFRDSKKMLLLK